MTTRVYHDEGTVSINSKKYWLARDPKTQLLLYNSVTEPTQHTNNVKQFANSDKIEVIWDDWSQGLGEGFYTGVLMASVKGKLYLPPAVGSNNAINGTLGQFSGLITSSVRYAFEEKDANGHWYLYLLAPQNIWKIDINGATPFLAGLTGPLFLSSTTSPFTSSDFIGQPVKAYDATDAGQRWFLPLDNANRIMVLDTVGTEASTAYAPAQTLTGAIDSSTTAVVVSGTAPANGDVLIIDSEKMYVRAGGGTSNLTVIRHFAGTTAAAHSNGVAVTHTLQDTWRAFTTVTDGASHFRMMPDGTIYRAIYDGVGGGTATPTQAKISLLAAGADLEANANWGAEFLVHNQSSRIRGMTNISDLMIILKDDGCFRAIKNPDNTLYFDDMLPDAQFHETVTVENQSFVQPAIWHGKVMIPSGMGFWRHNLWQALPVGPDAIAAVTGDEPAASGYEVKFGNICGLADAGTWLYATYNFAPNTSAFAYNNYTLVGKERTGAGGEPEKGEVIWYPLLFNTTDTRSQLVHLQQNGTGAPRVWVGTDGGDAYWFTPGKDGNPLFGLPGTGGGLYGDTSATYRFFLPPVSFPSLAMFREVQLFIEHSSANCSFSLTSFLNGTSGGNTIGSSITSTGSFFYTAGSSNDRGRRVQLQITATTNGSYTPALYKNTPCIVKVILLGNLLPSVGAELQATVDVRQTASKRGISEAKVRTELKNQIRTSALAFLDPHGFAGTALIQDIAEEPYPYVSGLEGASILGLRMTLLNYATTFAD